MKSKLFWVLILFCSALVASGAVFIFAFLVGESGLFLKTQTFHFFGEWLPSENLYAFGPLLAGSLLVSILATILAVPFSLALAVLGVCFLGVKARNFLIVLVDTAAGLPSVVVGLWGLLFVVPLLASYNGAGTSLFAATFILAFMVTPLLARFFTETLSGVHARYGMSAAALGMGPVAFCLRLAFPLARNGLLSGFALSLGRAMGETMAVLFVCGNIAKFPQSLFDPVRTVNTNIALEMAYATGAHRSSLFWGASLLLIMVFVFFMIANLFKRTAI